MNKYELCFQFKMHVLYVVVVFLQNATSEKEGGSVLEDSLSIYPIRYLCLVAIVGTTILGVESFSTERWGRTATLHI